MKRKTRRKIQELSVYLIISFFIIGIFTRMTYAGDKYTYDTINRLKTVDLDNGQIIAYTYDDLGNITSVAYDILGPEINLMQGGTDIPDGGSYHFGDVPINTSETVTFTIENLGDYNLTLDGSPRVQIIGSYFTLTQTPSSPIAPYNETTFEIEFSPPIYPGERSAQVYIENDDPDDDEDPYTFIISGTCIGGICAIDNGQDVMHPDSIIAPCEGATYIIESGEDIEFRAGKLIILKHGFWAKAGSDFRAHIDPSL